MTKYGFYSIVQKLPMVMDKDGKQEKAFDALDLDEAIPCILMSEEGAKKYRKNWARLLLPTRNLQFLKMVPTIDLLATKGLMITLSINSGHIHPSVTPILRTKGT
jgi:hypothetical protein